LGEFVGTLDVDKGTRNEFFCFFWAHVSLQGARTLR
jgi:hypothetical protein